MAAARGCGPAVVHLVEAGADPGLVLSGGATVLHMSADMGLGKVLTIVSRMLHLLHGSVAFSKMTRYP